MSIQGYMNATKNNIRVQKLYENPVVNKKDATLSAQLNSKPDSFEKEKSKDEDAKKKIKIGAAIVGAILLILAFLKREKIMVRVSKIQENGFPFAAGKAPDGDSSKFNPPSSDSSSASSKTKSKFNNLFHNQKQSPIEQNKDNPLFNTYIELKEEFARKYQNLDVNNPERIAMLEKLHHIEQVLIEYGFSIKP